jgi:hypothetical protein
MTKPRPFYTPQEVGNLTGFSYNFIIKDIKAGELEAVYVKPARSKVGRWRVTVTAALAYARKLGVAKHG